MQPIVYSYPLNQSINAFTEFSATYDTDALNSWYKINSEGITIGEEGFTKQIHFNCTDLANIIFNQTPCDKTTGASLTLSVKEIYDIVKTFGKTDSGEIEFKHNISFAGTVTFESNIITEGNAEFKGNVTVQSPFNIIFREADEDENVNLVTYISNHDWTFSNTITFSDVIKIKDAQSLIIGLNEETTNLEDYVRNKIAELGKFNVVIWEFTTPPEVDEADFNTIYLVPDKLPKPTYYKEFIKVEDTSKTPAVVWMEEIGSTKVDITGVLKKDESNTLPNYGESEYTNKPGIMFNNVFYSFEGLEYDDSVTQKFIKIDGGNRMPKVSGHENEPGIEFDGIFYSFDGLVKKEYNGPEFEADGSEITPDANGFLIYTAGTKSSVVIKPVVSSYIILDAAVLDENSETWSQINNVSKDGSQVVVDFNSTSPTNGSWLYIKTLCITDTSKPNIYDSVIFLRKNGNIPVPAQQQSNIEFEYAYGPDSYRTVSKSIIELNSSYNELKIKTSYYAILDAHLVSTNGLTALKGISRSENKDIVYINVNSSASGTDYLALKLLFFVNEPNNKGAYVTDRVIRITKSN